MSNEGVDRAGAAGLPPGCVGYRSTSVITDTTVAKGRLGRHSIMSGAWRLIDVPEGRLPYRVLDPPPERVLDLLVVPGLVEPGVPHQVAPPGPVRFQVEFYRKQNAAPDASG